MRALRAAHEVDPPDWAIGSGMIRDLVWDRLHGREPLAPRDVDLAFFDPDDLSPEREASVREAATKEGGSGGAARCGRSSPHSGPNRPHLRAPMAAALSIDPA
jgi:hypothetical protein